VSSFFIKQKIILEEDREVYEYSFEILFSTMLGFITMTAIAVITDTIFYTLFYLIGFIPLRVVAGGYHAKNHFLCFIILIITYSLFLFTFLIPLEHMIFLLTIGTLASVVLVFILAPSEDQNNPISMSNVARLKKKSRIIILICASFVGVSIYFTPDIKIAFSVMCGFFTVSISLLANYVKYRSIKQNIAISREEEMKNEET